MQIIPKMVSLHWSSNSHRCLIGWIGIFPCEYERLLVLLLKLLRKVDEFIPSRRRLQIILLEDIYVIEHAFANNGPRDSIILVGLPNFAQIVIITFISNSFVCLSALLLSEYICLDQIVVICTVCSYYIRHIIFGHSRFQYR